MIISNKMKAAIDALVVLGMKQRSGPVNLLLIARQLDVSISNLEMIFSQLRSHGLVVATRGPGGGYELAEQALHANVMSVISLFRSPTTPAPRAKGEESISIDALDLKIDALRVEFLSSVTISDLIEEQTRAEQTQRPERLSDQSSAAQQLRAIAAFSAGRPANASSANSAFFSEFSVAD
jgi:Rrf2 family transcriptional regulator, iron-sulfur cluster assembly transcription factor